VHDNKLQLAEKFGADYIINSKLQDIKSEILKITQGQGVNAVIDCVGAEETIRESTRMLEIKMPLVQSVINEYQVLGSLWGNYNELREVIELANLHKIKHSTQKFSLGDINKAIDLLRHGQIDGRAVIIPK
jgi:alcohol dehydrogenase, propanol-preferring